jgi:hypothetical protein
MKQSESSAVDRSKHQRQLANWLKHHADPSRIPWLQDHLNKWEEEDGDDQEELRSALLHILGLPKMTQFENNMIKQSESSAVDRSKHQRQLANWLKHADPSRIPRLQDHLNKLEAKYNKRIDVLLRSIADLKVGSNHEIESPNNKVDVVMPMPDVSDELNQKPSSQEEKDALDRACKLGDEAINAFTSKAGPHGFGEDI